MMTSVLSQGRRNNFAFRMLTRLVAGDCSPTRRSGQPAPDTATQGLLNNVKGGAVARGGGALALLAGLVLLLSPGDADAQSVSSDARLNDLTISGATLSSSGTWVPTSHGVTLTPAFDSDTLEYTGIAHHEFRHARVTAEPMDPGATADVAVNGTRIGQYTGINELATEVITVEVTAEDGVTTLTYRVVLLTKVTLVGLPSSTEESRSAAYEILVVTNKPVAEDTTIRVSINSTRAFPRATLASDRRLIRLEATDIILAGRNRRARGIELTFLDNSRLGDYRLRVSGTVIDNPDVYNSDDVYVTIIDDDLPAMSPDAPRNFKVTSEAGKTTFNWDNVVTPAGADRISYEIFVRNPGDSDDDWRFLVQSGMIEPRFGRALHEGPLTSQRLPVGGTYEFALRALARYEFTARAFTARVSGVGEFTAPVTHTVLGPNRPRDLAADRAVDGSVRLTWQPPPLYLVGLLSSPAMPVPVSNLDTGVTRYTIFRAEEPADDSDPLTPWDEGAVYSEIGSVAANVLTYTDTDADADKAYLYRVKATSPDGLSDFSNLGFEHPRPPYDDAFLLELGDGSESYSSCGYV